MAKKAKKKVAKKRGWFAPKAEPEEKPEPEPKTDELIKAIKKPSVMARNEKIDPAPKLPKGWPKGSPNPADVQCNHKGEHIVGRGPEGEWVFKMHNNKKIFVKES